MTRDWLPGMRGAMKGKQGLYLRCICPLPQEDDPWPHALHHLDSWYFSLLWLRCKHPPRPSLPPPAPRPVALWLYDTERGPAAGLACVGGALWSAMGWAQIKCAHAAPPLETANKQPPQPHRTPCTLLHTALHMDQDGGHRRRGKFQR